MTTMPPLPLPSESESGPSLHPSPPFLARKSRTDSKTQVPDHHDDHHDDHDDPNDRDNDPKDKDNDKDLADQYLQGLSQLSAASVSLSLSQSQSQSQSQSLSQSQGLPTPNSLQHHHRLPIHGGDNDDNGSLSDTAPAADPPTDDHHQQSHRPSRHCQRDASSPTPPLSPSSSTHRYPPISSIPGRSGLANLAAAALQPRADPNALLAASSLSDGNQGSSQNLFDFPAAPTASSTTSATHHSRPRPSSSPDMTETMPSVPAVVTKPNRHLLAVPLMDGNPLLRTRSLEATLGVDAMLHPMDANPDDIIPRASGFSQTHSGMSQSQSRLALAGMPAVRFESQMSSQGLSPLPFSTRANARQYPPQPSPTTPTGPRRRAPVPLPLESPITRPPPGAAADVSSPTSPTNSLYPHAHALDHHHHHHEEPNSVPLSMYNEPLNHSHSRDDGDHHRGDVDMPFPESQRSPSPLPYAGPIDDQNQYPMSPFAQHPFPPPITNTNGYPVPPAHGRPLTRHRSRGLESAMGDMELDGDRDVDMDVDSRHSAPVSEAMDDHEDHDDQGPFGRHHDAYAAQGQYNTQLPSYHYTGGHAGDDLEHDQDALDLMELVPGPSAAHFSSRTTFQRRGRSSSLAAAAAQPPSSSARDLSTAPPTSSRSGSPTGSRTSAGTHTTGAGGMPVLIPSTTKKSHTNCRSLPAVLEYPDYLIPIDAPIQSKRGGAPAAVEKTAAGRVTRARARNSAPASSAAAAHVEHDGTAAALDSSSSSPAVNTKKRKRVSAPTSITPSSAAALALHAPPPPAATTAVSRADDDLLDDESGMDFDGLDPREAKRIRNTISARRSRARKAAKIEYLERRVNDLEVDGERLRADNDQLRALLVAHGIPVPPPPIAGASASGGGVEEMGEK